MASRQYRFYSATPRTVFDHVAANWPAAMVRRHGWKIGHSDIWYLTIVLDESEAANAFEAWLKKNSRRTDIGRLVGNKHGYKNVILHPRFGPLTFLKLQFLALRRGWR